MPLHAALLSRAMRLRMGWIVLVASIIATIAPMAWAQGVKVHGRVVVPLDVLGTVVGIVWILSAAYLNFLVNREMEEHQRELEALRRPPGHSGDQPRPLHKLNAWGGIAAGGTGLAALKFPLHYTSAHWLLIGLVMLALTLLLLWHFTRQMRGPPPGNGHR